MGASLPTRINTCFTAMETSQFIFNQKVSDYTISWEGYAFHVLRLSGSTVNPFSEAWGKCEFASYCKVLLQVQNAIHKKCQRQLARGVLLHHDNASHHTAQVIQERIQELQ
jgi:hypothetical protein